MKKQVIYVIESAGTRELSGLNSKVIGIGQTDDWPYLHAILGQVNPTAKVLYTLSGAQGRDLLNLWNFFRRYQTEKLGWFHVDSVIHKFFSEYKSLKEIREIIPEVSKVPMSGSDLAYKFNHLMTLACRFFGDQVEETLVDWKVGTEEDILKVLKYLFPSQYPSFISLYQHKLSDSERDLLGQVDSMLVKEESEDRILKYICGYPGVQDVYPLLPEPYRQILGRFTTGECACCSYNVQFLLDKYMEENIVKDPKVRHDIYKTFKTGDHIPTEIVRDKLNKVYRSKGYMKKAKGTDLDLFYETSPIDKTIDGERLRGLKVGTPKSPNAQELVEDYELSLRYQIFKVFKVDDELTKEEIIKRLHQVYDILDYYILPEVQHLGKFFKVTYKRPGRYHLGVLSPSILCDGIYENLKSYVYLEFETGQRFTRDELLLRLKKIFVRGGYFRDPRTSDIKYWFDVKESEVAGTYGIKLLGKNIQKVTN